MASPISSLEGRSCRWTWGLLNVIFWKWNKRQTVGWSWMLMGWSISHTGQASGSWSHAINTNKYLGSVLSSIQGCFQQIHIFTQTNTDKHTHRSTYRWRGTQIRDPVRSQSPSWWRNNTKYLFTKNTLSFSLHLSFFFSLLEMRDLLG